MIIVEVSTLFAQNIDWYSNSLLFYQEYDVNADERDVYIKKKKVEV